jgi:hypothetical protein
VAEKIKIYENLALEIKNMRKFNNIFIYPFITSAEEVATKNFLQYPENIGLSKTSQGWGKNQYYYTHVIYVTQHPMTRPLTLWDRMTFLPLTETNPFDNQG